MDGHLTADEQDDRFDPMRVRRLVADEAADDELGHALDRFGSGSRQHRVERAIEAARRSDDGNATRLRFRVDDVVPEHGLQVAGGASGDLVPIRIGCAPESQILFNQRVEAPLLPVVEVLDLLVAEVRREPGAFPRVLDAVVVRSQKQQVRQELQGGNAARDVVAQARRDQAAPIDDPQPADPTDVADLADQNGRARFVALAEPSSHVFQPLLPCRRFDAVSDLLGRVSQHRQRECEDRDRRQQDGGERALGADAEVARQEFRRLLAEPARPNQAGVDAQGEQERAEDVQRVVVPRVSGQRSDRGVAEESTDREGDQGPEGGSAAQQRGGAHDQKSRQGAVGRRSSAPGRGCRLPADCRLPRRRPLEPDPDSATARRCSRPLLRSASWA